MEEKNLNEQESLKLITEMIQNSKKNLQLGTGNLLLLWGYLCSVTALVVYALVKITGNPTWNFLWFAIPAIGYPIWFWHMKKKVRPALSYTDKVLQTIWKVIGQYGIIVSILSCLYFEALPFLIPIILIMCSLGMCITGSIIDDKLMYNCSGVGIAIGVVMASYVLNPPELDIQYIVFAFCFIIMMVIPGHRLNREVGNPHTKE